MGFLSDTPCNRQNVPRCGKGTRGCACYPRVKTTTYRRKGRTDMSQDDDNPTPDLRTQALEYHRQHPPGKIKVVPTKALVTQKDLSLAYSPGVAAACDL